MTEQLKELTVGELKVRVLALPPPHMMFLASKMQSVPSDDALVMLKRAGGLAALVVRYIGDEPVVNERKLPRDLSSLEDLGEGFIMAAYEAVGSYDALGELFHGVIASYHAGSAPNPT